MRSPGRLAGLSIVCAMTWAVAATARAAAPQATPADPAVPTAIEEALIEHACGALRPAGALETAPYLECRNNQLLHLRTEFGRDLRRLSNAERRTIDSACNSLRATRGQDAYIACLTAQLASLPGHGKAKQPEAAGGAALPAPAPPAAEVPPAVQSSSSLSGVWIGAALAVLVVVAAVGAFVSTRARRAFGTCRSCGVKLTERGDLCHACRHEAAENLRRATTERADQARAQDEELRRQAAREIEQQQHARDEEARRQQIEQDQEAQARQQEEDVQRRRDEELRQERQIDAAATQDEFDPHVVLGVPRDASAAAIEAAYQAARLKYDLDLVADMGGELQEHFKRKAEAAQRAYEILTTGHGEA